MGNYQKEFNMIQALNRTYYGLKLIKDTVYQLSQLSEKEKLKNQHLIEAFECHPTGFDLYESWSELEVMTTYLDEIECRLNDLIPENAELIEKVEKEKEKAPSPAREGA